MKFSIGVGVAYFCFALPVHAFDLPASCDGVIPPPDAMAPIGELRSRVETLFETDPVAVVALLCVTIPRVEIEYGADSAELAWWVGSLATPLIAYMDRHDEAIPLLDFALPLYERHLGPTSAEVADVHVAHAWINFRKGYLEESSQAWQRALAVREKNPGTRQIELQKVLVGLAHVRLAQRDFEGARAALDRARVILRDNGDDVSEAAAAIENAYTNIAMREEDYGGARVHAERQLEIERALLRTEAQLVSANVVYAQILERLDEYEAAELVLREAIRLAEASEAAPLQRHQLTALTQLAATLNDRGKPSEAAAFAQRAVELGTATLGAEAPRMVRVYLIRAEVHRALGELPRALADYTRAEAIIVAHPDDVERQTRVAFYRGKGALDATLGDNVAARAALRAALAAAGDEPTLTIERAHVLLALGRSDVSASQKRRREQLVMAKSLLSARLPGSHPDILGVANELCGLEIEAPFAPACDEAAARFAGAREVAPSLSTLVLLNQSRRAQARCHDEDAYTAAVDALSVASALATPDPQWRALFRLGEVLHGRGDPRLAIFFGKQSVVEIERLRGYFTDDDRRFERGFLADKVSVYRTVADWLFDSGRIDEGLELLGLLKTEEMHDFILRDATASISSGAVSFTEAEQALFDSYQNMRRGASGDGEAVDRLSRLRETDRISVQESLQLNQLLARQQRQTVGRSDALRAWVSDARMLPDAQARPARLRSARIERMRAGFGNDAAFAAFLMTPSHLRVILATSHGVTERMVPVSATSLRRDVGRLLDDISARREVTAQAQALFTTLLGPVDEVLTVAGVRRLVLWPDAALRYLPFDALHDGTRFVGERFSLQMYAQAPRDAEGSRRAASGIRGLGVTQAIGAYRPLPAMAQELCTIIDGPIHGFEDPSAACAGTADGRGVVAGEGYVDGMFTGARLRALLSGERTFDLLHLGTHFDLRPGNAMRSTLLLGDGTRLTLDEIAKLDFGGLELVTLSACQTGVGGAMRDDGREVEGLSAVVQRRGARRVVASRWSVEDASTARFMATLYSALASSPGDAAGALGRARAVIRDTAQYSHPYYWAGFYLSGELP